MFKFIEVMTLCSCVTKFSLIGNPLNLNLSSGRMSSLAVSHCITGRQKYFIEVMTLNVDPQFKFWQDELACIKT